MNQPDLTELAALAGEPASAMMPAALCDGRALSAGKLALAHLSKLLAGGFVRSRAQGRYRYYEIASALTLSKRDLLLRVFEITDARRKLDEAVAVLWPIVQ